MDHHGPLITLPNELQSHTRLPHATCDEVDNCEKAPQQVPLASSSFALVKTKSRTHLVHFPSSPHYHHHHHHWLDFIRDSSSSITSMGIAHSPIGGLPKIVVVVLRGAPDQHRAAQRVNVRAAEELIRDVAITAGGGTHSRRTAAITSTAPRTRAARSYAGMPDPPKSLPHIFGRVLRGYSS
ncbi:hypothetical protein BJV74DRAFT_988377 [Russula compacta]|nr:hypothetical protein BJV74DRAFT_988377 [Russula compacta]